MVVPGGAPIAVDSPCFSKTTISLSKIVNGITNLTINAEGATSLTCSDIYLLSTLVHVGFEEIKNKGDNIISWNVTGISESNMFDLNTMGIRVYRFLEGIEGLIYDLNMTLALFQPYTTQAVDDYYGALNTQFLADYAWHKYNLRTTEEVLVDASLINDGDFLGVIRLDGLDTVLAWAMGSTTGHTTIALRDPNGVLHICESTVSSAYWPTDNIQCTEYTQWLSQAKAAGYLVTHAPLSAASRSAFNPSAAWSYVQSVLGFEYGFYNQFWGWLDTDEDNYPCLPPDWSTCLMWQHWQVITGWLDMISPPLCDQFFKQSLNKRLGTNYSTVSDIYQEAATQGYTVGGLYNTVELDSYTYNTNRNGQPAQGPSMVCCVFVCNAWKHGGLFGNITDQVNCGEFANWDDYALHLYDDNYQKPPQCQAADPDSPTCQLEGKYTLRFNDYNTKTPVAHMAETCSAQNPYYTRPPNC